MQTWQKVDNHFPPLTGKEPPEMIADEEGEEEEKEEDEAERMKLDFEALSQEAAARTRDAKRGATSSSQTSREGKI
jgi:hypothetical protein